VSPLAVVPDTVATLNALLAARAAAEDVDVGTVRSRRAEGDEPPYTLLGEGGDIRPRGNAPVLNPARVGCRVFDLTDGGAARRYREISALLHRFGPARVELAAEDGGSVGIWKVFDETGVQAPLQEPETGWWVASGVFDLYMTDRGVG
jgi:hypothetical protein